jgi:hypothetical protein
MKLHPLGANQNELTLANGDVILFSYATPVAARLSHGCYKTEVKYSVTAIRAAMVGM